MEDRKKVRLVLVVAALALAGAVGVAVTVSERPISYTGSPPNPSESPSSPGAAGPVAAAPVARRPPVDDFAFTDETGKPLRLADFRGRTILVNLWATWCPPCIAEMPDLDALQGRLGGEGFQVVAVSLDRGGAPVARRWLDRAGLANLAVYNASSADFQGALLPTSILVDAQGRVAWQGSGAKEWASPELMAVVEEVMRGK